MKKLILTTIMFFWVVLGSHAVLQEKNLNQTLEVLNVELSSTFSQLKGSMEMLKGSSQRQHESMVQAMQKSNQTALMLYSQKFDFTFNLAYACHEAAVQYFDFTSKVVPYDRIKEDLDMEIQRYTHLMQSLQELPPTLVHHEDSLGRDSVEFFSDTISVKGIPFALDKEGQANRKACLKYAKSILAEYGILRDAINEDNEYYNLTRERLKTVFEYAQLRYKNIQKSIFINGSDNYVSILTNMPRYIRRAARDWKNKYDNDIYADKKVQSEWRGPIVLGLIAFVAFYFAVAFLLSNLIVRLLMHKVKKFQNKELRLKMDCMITGASFVIFALAFMILRIFMRHSFLIMASHLLVSFAWLMAVIFASLFIRLRGQEIGAALKIYMPITFVGFIVIVFRIIFIPNSVVSLLFPPLLLLFTIWQFTVLVKEHKKVPLSDKFYSWISFSLIVITCIMAWMGYVLMSVEVFIWWLIQLTLIQTISCAYDWLRNREKRYMSRKLGKKHLEISHSIIKRDGNNIQHTWLFDFMGMALVPIATILSVLFSIYYAAEVFDLTEICQRIFFAPLIQIKGICSCSIFKLVLVGCMYFLFNYMVYAIKAFYRFIRHLHLQRRNKGLGVATNQANISLFNNVISIIIWGIYLIFALSILDVPKTGLSYVSAGLATGVGFAMKSLIENFFYGISLMTGRLRAGDWIECDGIRGVVENITYQSTQILTEYGQVITLMNSTLFTGSFKNLTKNHLYEKTVFKVGVAYGTDIEHVRKIIVEGIQSLTRKDKNGRDVLNLKKGVSVLMADFAESSVDLYVVYWVLVENKTFFDCVVKEKVYNVLTKCGIEIPFPQRDVHMK